MKIIVRSLSGIEQTVTAEPTSTVLAFKEYLKDLLTTDPITTLACNGVELKDEDTLSQYNLVCCYSLYF